MCHQEGSDRESVSIHSEGAACGVRCCCSIDAAGVASHEMPRTVCSTAWSPEHCWGGLPQTHEIGTFGTKWTEPQVMTTTVLCTWDAGTKTGQQTRLARCRTHQGLLEEPVRGGGIAEGSTLVGPGEPIDTQRREPSSTKLYPKANDKLDACILLVGR